MPPLVFLLILAVLALGVWWKVLRKDEDKSAEVAAPCTSTLAPEAVAKLKNLKNVKIRVLNGTSTKGLAGLIRDELVKRGFTVVEIGNAPADRAITGAGEIHYGKSGLFNAEVVGKNAAGYEMVLDSARKGTIVDLIAGQDYKGLVAPATAKTEVTKLIKDTAENGLSCSSASPSA